MTCKVIQAPAGYGKTEQAIDFIARQPKGLRVEVYVPTHALAQEWKNKFDWKHRNVRAKVIAGRGHLDHKGETLCRRNDLATRLISFGQSVFPNLCRSGGPTGVYRCPHYDRCGYIRQFSNSDVRIYTHQHLFLERGMLDDEVPDLVFIDESFAFAGIRKVTFSIQRLQDLRLPQEAKDICHALWYAMVTGGSHTTVVRSAKRRGGGLSKAIKALRHGGELPSPSTSDWSAKKLLDSIVCFDDIAFLLEHLCNTLDVRDEHQSVTFDPDKGEVTVHHCSRITRFAGAPGQTGPEIFILDATANETLINAFFQDATFVRHGAQRNARVLQLKTSRGSISSFVPERNKNPRNAMDATRNLQRTQELIDQQSFAGQRVLVVGTTAVTGNPAQSVPPKLTAPDGCVLAHFNAVRGVDQWKNLDVAIIVGRNQPPVEVVEDYARAIFAYDPVPLNLTGELVFEDRGYRMKDGRLLGTQVHVHQDPRVQAVMEQMREAESSQAIDRLRLIHNKEPKLVIILSNLVLDIDVDELVTWDDLLGGPLQRVIRDCDGVLPQNPGWLSTRYPGQWPSTAAAKKYLQRLRKRGHFANSISIEKMSPLEYRAAGARQFSRALSRHADMEITRAALSKALGTPVEVRRCKVTR